MAESKDDYEADFMGGEDALFREKNVSRVFAWLMILLALGTVLASGAAALAADAGLAPALITLLSGGFVAGTGLFFAAMRTTVTEQHVSVQYGLLGPTIDVAQITDCEVVELGTAAKLMFGPKIWPEGWRYIPPGVESGVRIKWNGAKGETTCTIGATDAVGLATAIREARARAAAGTGVRVELDEEQDVAEVEARATDDGRRRKA